MTKKEQVLAVLQYWKTIEFLDQVDLQGESPKNIKVHKEIQEGKKVSHKKIEHFTPLHRETVSQLNLPQQLKQETEAFPQFPAVGKEIQYAIGALPRNDYVKYLQKFLPDRQEEPELPYPKKSALAWCGLKTDLEGNYLPNSFRLSPLLWVSQQWETYAKGKVGEFLLDLESYEELLELFEETLEEQHISEILPDLYDKLWNTYVQYIAPLHKEKTLGYYVYPRYLDEEEKEKDEYPPDYSDLGKSYFLQDISLLIQTIEADEFDGSTPYQQQVMDYILSPYANSKGLGDLPRTTISPKEPQTAMKEFFTSALEVDKAPLGKWPSKFMPVLMQQVAVNLAIDETASATPIFSVNGPPGTGKTTLLKEVVASNVVERAILLAEFGDDPDAAFVRRSFQDGPLSDSGNSYFKFAPAYFALKNDKINDYGMLVTSCNNAAVENITADLPKGGDILGSLEFSDSDHPAVQEGLQEIIALYDVEQSKDIETIKEYGKTTEEKDIYFTRYANKLLKATDSWGLISAPMGKKKNISHYCRSVLLPFLNQYKSKDLREAHLKQYAVERAAFLKQLAVVKTLQKELVTRSKDPRQWAQEGDEAMAVIDAAFLENYRSPEEDPATEAQATNPWFTDKYNRAREKLLFHACRLQKEFIISSKYMRQNFINLMIAWNMYPDCENRMTDLDRETAMPVLFQSLFLLTPVISTTFASAQTFLKDIKTPNTLGTLIVDESGQAPPQMAVGSLFRCRKAIIVGDPKQIEPVVTAESDMIKKLMGAKLLAPYKDKRLSVQGCADYLNPYGTFLGEGEEQEWVGCPLIVHRRCIDPMYRISNHLSYDDTMKQKTGQPKQKVADGFILPQSAWIDVKGEEVSDAKNHFVPAQGEAVMALLTKKFKTLAEEALPKLFIITPFSSVKLGMVSMIEGSSLYKEDPRVKKWMSQTSIGTVHTFQGQGTDEVIFLLGCDGAATAAANWVNKNIVNVAATRAKFRFYIVGDEKVWTCEPVKVARLFSDVHFPVSELETRLYPHEKKATAPEKVPVKPQGTPSKMEFEPPKLVYKSTPPVASPTPVAPVASPAPVAPVKKAVATDSLGRCPKCNEPLVKKSGQYGEFIGCSAYFKTKCNYTEKIK